MDDVYDAERILEEKEEDGQMKYLIKWKGWSTKHNSWEPAENILDRRLFDAFERKKRKERRKSSNQSKSLDATQNSEVAQDRTLDPLSASISADPDPSTILDIASSSSNDASSSVIKIESDKKLLKDSVPEPVPEPISSPALTQTSSPSKSVQENLSNGKASPVSLAAPVEEPSPSPAPTSGLKPSSTPKPPSTPILPSQPTPLPTPQSTPLSAPAQTISDTQLSPTKQLLSSEQTTLTKQILETNQEIQTSAAPTSSPAPILTVGISNQAIAPLPSPKHALQTVSTTPIQLSGAPVNVDIAPSSPSQKSMTSKFNPTKASPTSLEIKSQVSGPPPSPRHATMISSPIPSQKNPAALGIPLPSPIPNQKPVTSKSNNFKSTPKPTIKFPSSCRSQIRTGPTPKIKSVSGTASPFQRVTSIEQPLRYSKAQIVAVRIPPQQATAESSHIQANHQNTSQTVYRPSPAINTPMRLPQSVKPKRNNLLSNNFNNQPRQQFLVTQHIVNQQQAGGQCHDSRLTNQPAPIQHSSQIQQSNIQNVPTQTATLLQKLPSQIGTVQHSPLIQDQVVPMDQEPISLDIDTNDESFLEQSLYLSDAAILGTVITDVTVNNQTISICECKTERGFFRDKDKHSVAVETVDE